MPQPVFNAAQQAAIKAIADAELAPLAARITALQGRVFVLESKVMTDEAMSTADHTAIKDLQARVAALAGSSSSTPTGGTVTPPPPAPGVPQTITTFTVVPNAIVTGATVTITWVTANATSVKLDGVSVAGSGSTTATPTVNHTYTLVALGTTLPDVEATASVTVSSITPPPPPPPPTGVFTIQGSGTQYGTFVLAQAAAVDGDTILVDPGAPFPGGIIGKSLTIKSSVAGSRYNVTAPLINTDGTGTGITKTMVVQDAYFGFFKPHPNTAGGPDNASKCVNWAGEMMGSLTVRNCVCEDCPMPILTSRFVTDVTIENCGFQNCGSTDEPNTHGIYIHATNSLTVLGCKFWWTYTIPQGTAPIPNVSPYNGDITWCGIGHAIKSRSKATTVEACFIDNRLGSMTEQIDIAEAGSLTALGNTILEGPYSGDDPTVGPPYATDNKIIGYICSPGPPEWPAGPIVLEQNTIVNYGAATENLVRVVGTSPSSYTVRENFIVGTMADVPSANYPPATNTIITSTSGVFVAPASNNFAPVTPVAGAANYAPYIYVEPYSHSARTDLYRGAVPGPVALPAYMSGKAVGQWFEVPNTLLAQTTFPSMAGQGFGSSAEITNYSGGAARTSGSYFILKGGGHASTLNNMMVAIKLSDNAPAWTTISPCTPFASIQNPYAAQARYLDGKMCAGHSGYKDLFDPVNDVYVQVGSGVSFTGSGGSLYIDTFFWSFGGSSSPTAGWVPSNTLVSANEYYGGPNWSFNGTTYTASTYQLFKCNMGDTLTTLVGNYTGNVYRELYGACIVDTKRGYLVWAGELDPNGAGGFLHQISPTTAGSNHLLLTGTSLPRVTYSGGWYEPFLDVYMLIFPGNSNIYQVSPTTGVASVFATTGSLGFSSLQNTVMGRAQFLPELKAAVFQEPSDDNYQGRLMMVRTG